MADKPIRPPKGRLFIGMDFSSIEARILTFIKGGPHSSKVHWKNVRTGRIAHPPKFNMKELG